VFSNVEEYIAGTDPFDTASFFAVTNMVVDSIEVEMEWASLFGRTYGVLWSPDLSTPFVRIEEGIDYPENSYVHPVGTHQSGFLKVDVRVK